MASNYDPRNYDPRKERALRRDNVRTERERIEMEQEAMQADRLARLERVRRREAARQEQERIRKEKERRDGPEVIMKDFPVVDGELRRPTEAVKRVERLVNTTQEERELREQGVVLSDGEETHIQGPAVPQSGDDDGWETVDEDQNVSLYLSELEEGGAAINIIKERVIEIQERTDQFHFQRQKMEERMEELQRREALAMEQERQLRERQERFQESLKEKEARVREEMNMKMQDKMYRDSLNILRNMEAEMQERQRAADEKERELFRRENALREAELSWRNKKAAMENAYLEKIRQEEEREILRRATALHSPPPIEKVKDETGGVRKKTLFYYEPESKQTDLESMYRKERDGTVRGNDTGNQIKVDKIESEERTTLNRAYILWYSFCTQTPWKC